MSKLIWDTIGERFYEVGVDRGVLYPQTSDGKYPKGVAWSGLSNVNESPSGAETTAIWADNMKYLNLVSAEEFGATIEAYFYPDEFKACNGEAAIAKGVTAGQQSRQSFGFAYRTKLANDTVGEDYGYRLHLIYNCKATPSEKSHGTTNDSTDLDAMSWTVSTTSINVPGHKPTSTLTIDSTTADPVALAKLEAILWGDDENDARLPLPEEVITIMGGVEG